MNFFLLFSCFVASIGGFLFGYSLVTGSMLVVDPTFIDNFCVGVYGDKTQCYSTDTESQPEDWVVFNTSFQGVFGLGSMVGSLMGAMFSDRLGRRVALLMASSLFLSGSIGTMFSGNEGGLFFSRMVEGLGAGMSATVSPVYVVEMSLRKNRGALSSLMPLSLTIGLLVASAIGEALMLVGLNWRTLLAVGAVPGLIMLLGMLVVPETPRWLMIHSGYSSCEKVLKQIRSGDIKAEIMDMVANVGEDEMTLSYLLKQDGIIYRLVISCGIQICNQLMGIGALLSYGPLLIGGMNVVGRGYFTVALFAMAVVGTLGAACLMDTCGRRTLLLRGGVGMFVGHIGCASCYIAYDQTDNNVFAYGFLLCMCLVMCNYSLTWGPISWVYPAEIFPSETRAKAVAFIQLVYYACLYLSSFYLLIMHYMGVAHLFFTLALAATASVWFVYMCLPETAGAGLEEMGDVFNVFRANLSSNGSGGLFNEILHGSKMVKIPWKSGGTCESEPLAPDSDADASEGAGYDVSDSEIVDKSSVLA